MISFQINGLFCPICKEQIKQLDISKTEITSNGVLVAFECFNCKVPTTLAMDTDSL